MVAGVRTSIAEYIVAISSAVRSRAASFIAYLTAHHIGSSVIRVYVKMRRFQLSIFFLQFSDLGEYNLSPISRKLVTQSADHVGVNVTR